MLIHPTEIVQSSPGIVLSNQPEGISVKMSDPVKGFKYALNILTLTFDLSLYENVRLRFEAREFGDEPHAPPSNPFSGDVNFNGAAISADGNEWYEVQDLRNLRSDRFTGFEIDLDAAVIQWGLQYNVEFLVRFCQYDNNPAPMDGIYLQRISLTGEFPGLYIHLPMDDNEDNSIVHDASAALRHQTFLDPGGDANKIAHSVIGANGLGLLFDGVDDNV